MKNLFSEYFKELLGEETIETHDGFVTYSMADDHIFISHLYVRPEKRTTDLMIDLCTQVGLEGRAQGKKFLRCLVDTTTERASENLLLFLKYGLKVSELCGKYIVLDIDLQEVP